jgi:molybdopterin synthase catalytic subunit
MYITKQPIDMNKFMRQSSDSSCGAVVTFEGRVRDHHHGRKVKRLYYECYEAVANKEIERIMGQVRFETGTKEIRLIHRVGQLEIEDTAIVISVGAPHREEAFTACRAVIDRVKSSVPIWKREFYEDGSDAWVLCSQEERLIS